MNLVLKLEHYDDADMNIVNAINVAEFKSVKLSTNKLDIIPDRDDDRIIKTLKGVKIIYEMKVGILILIGNLSCRFKSPYGGEFFLKRAHTIEEKDYEDIRGIEANIRFSTTPCSIEEMRNHLRYLSTSSEFKFNLTQFEDFMVIFEYYKKLSDELNNSASFRIKSITDNYFFLPYNVKGIRDEDNELIDEIRNLNPVYDENDILKGYIIPSYIRSNLENSINDFVQELCDVVIDYEDDAIKKIKKMREDIYVSDFRDVNEKNSSKLKSVEIINVFKDKKTITLSLEGVEDGQYQYVNLYDMGQKIKVESIDNSLRLINQGATGTAVEMIEYLIGDKKMPNRGARTSKVKEKYMIGLNESQKQAFLKAVDGSPVTLIKGPPGTGKTHVINAITQYITKELKEKVVVSSQTHVAIDNVLDKLMENNDIVVPNRITNRRNKYSGIEIDRTLYKTWGSKFEKHNLHITNQDLASKIVTDVKGFKGDHKILFSEKIGEKSNFMVIGATTTTSAIAGRKGLEVLEGYNWLIIDEVSKCPITEVLRYLPYVDKIIMVGDDYQLSPLLEFSKEDVAHLPSYDEDLFEKLQEVYEKSVFADTIKKAEESSRLVILNENYRSVQNVLRAYNIFYGDSLENRREEVNPKKVRFDGLLSNFNEKDTMFVNVKRGSEQRDSKSPSRYNIEELKATSIMLNDLIECTVNPQEVTVAAIFPYGAQISEFSKRYRDLINKAKLTFRSFDVDTVDAFQGRESDIVLVNTVVTTTKPNFLRDFRRINVSMSRAKDKLILFGNPHILRKIEMKIYGGSSRNYLDDIINDINKYGLPVDYNPGKEMQYESTRKSTLILK